MRRFRRRSGDRGGFTLMELLIVLAILVLLIALVGQQVFKAADEADINVTKSQIGLLENALADYRRQVKTYPGTEQGLEALLSKPGASEESGSSVSRWSGPYIDDDKLPTDAWGNDFQYEFPPTRGRGSKPDIWSWGPDGKDATEDDIKNWSGDGEGGSGESGQEGDEFGDFEEDNTMGFEDAMGGEDDGGFGDMMGGEDDGGFGGMGGGDEFGGMGGGDEFGGSGFGADPPRR